ncbi:MAG: hypothetical protein QXN63_03645 [Candidatus Bathyarchaeia archaeon]
MEHCKNPWNGECKKIDIEVYVFYKGKQLPICKDCWREIAEKDIEW